MVLFGLINIFYNYFLWWIIKNIFVSFRFYFCLVMMSRWVIYIGIRFDINWCNFYFVECLCKNKDVNVNWVLFKNYIIECISFCFLNGYLIVCRKLGGSYSWIL